MRVHFKVRYDCVYGFRFVNNVWRHFIKGKAAFKNN